MLWGEITPKNLMGIHLQQGNLKIAPQNRFQLVITRIGYDGSGGLTKYGLAKTKG